MSQERRARLHDDSPYEAGFAFGYELPVAVEVNGQEAPPLILGANARRRWRRGFLAGVQARETRLAIRTLKSQRHEHRYAGPIRENPNYPLRQPRLILQNWRE